jgi:L-ascorbate metabolism protein UlaG (beta-lactamase superfamily)
LQYHQDNFEFGGVMDNICVNTRSSIKIIGTKTIYFDPLDIDGMPCDADMVFVTHEHYDHFSPEDIRKVLKKDTQIIVPLGMTDLIMEKMRPIQSIQGILPWQTENYDGVKCQGIPAYNIDKQFHPKNNNWLGYLVELDGKTYYIMGDTDATDEAAQVNAEVVFIPIGGKYTMDATQAAEFINKKQPKLVIPIHYEDSRIGNNFKKVLRPGTEVQLFL